MKRSTLLPRLGLLVGLAAAPLHAAQEVEAPAPTELGVPQSVQEAVAHGSADLREGLAELPSEKLSDQLDAWSLLVDPRSLFDPPLRVGLQHRNTNLLLRPALRDRVANPLARRADRDLPGEQCQQSDEQAVHSARDHDRPTSETI